MKYSAGTNQELIAEISALKQRIKDLERSKSELTEQCRRRVNMAVPHTDITLADLLDQIPMNLQYVDQDGFLRFLNKAAAARPAHAKREVGVNIRNCHALPESLEMLKRIFEDFAGGRKEPHYYVSKSGNKSMKVPIFSAEGDFLGVVSYSHPVGFPKIYRTF